MTQYDSERDATEENDSDKVAGRLQDSNVGAEDEMSERVSLEELADDTVPQKESQEIPDEPLHEATVVYEPPGRSDDSAATQDDSAAPSYDSAATRNGMAAALVLPGDSTASRLNAAASRNESSGGRGEAVAFRHDSAASSPAISPRSDSATSLSRLADGQTAVQSGVLG